MYLVRWKQIKINTPNTLLTQECEKFVGGDDGYYGNTIYLTV